MSEPIEIVFNGERHSIAPATSIAALVAELGLDARHVAVEVNLQLVSRGRHSEYTLSPGDRVEVVTLVGGG